MAARGGEGGGGDEDERYHDAPGDHGDAGNDGRRGGGAELGHRISGLPVVNPAGEVVGIVTEGDLLRRAETGTERRRARWLEFLIAPGRLASEYAHANGRRVGEVMTDTVVSVARTIRLRTSSR